MTTTRIAVLLPVGVLLGAAGGGLAWLGVEERMPILLELGLGLAGGGLACLLLGLGRGLWALLGKSHDLGLRQYRRHRGVLQPVLVAALLLFVLLGGLVGHNYVVWAAIERDCELALNTDDRVEAQWALNRGLATMDDPLLLIPSDLLDLWGPNRCRAAIERHELVLGDRVPESFRDSLPRPAAPATPPGRPQLRKYSLRDQGYTDAQLIAWLAGVEPYNGLTSLVLPGNRLTAASLEALAGSGIGVLHTLLLAGNPIGDAGAEVLAGSPAFSPLAILYLQETGLGPAGVASLLAADSGLDALVDLDLSGNPLGDDGARILAAGPRSARLTHLYLDRTGLTDRGVLALAQSPHLGALEYLSLDGNELTAAGVAAARANAAWPATAEVFFGERFE